MEEWIRDGKKKLTLWHTPYFKPIMNHEELEPILTVLGFEGLPPSDNYKEYIYLGKFSRTAAAAAAASMSTHLPPRPRLPYPEIDGLHIYTYRAFMDAVNYYIHMSNFCDLFHIRGLLINMAEDKDRNWGRIGIIGPAYLYREETLDEANEGNYGPIMESFEYGYESLVMRVNGYSTPVGDVAPLQDILTKPKLKPRKKKKS